MTKIHAKCFQITDKTSSSYTDDSINQASITLSVLAQENWVMKNKNVYRAAQSDNVVFAGSTCDILLFWRLEFLVILFCKPQQRCLGLSLKNKFLKKFSLIPFIWTLVLVFILDLLHNIVYTKIAALFFLAPGNVKSKF